MPAQLRATSLLPWQPCFCTGAAGGRAERPVLWTFGGGTQPAPPRPSPLQHRCVFLEQAGWPLSPPPSEPAVFHLFLCLGWGWGVFKGLNIISSMQQVLRSHGSLNISEDS